MIRFIALLTLLPSLALGAPLGTDFTFQGQLVQDGQLANGPYDFEFQIYDVVSGGVQLLPPIAMDDVEVTDGFFSVQLDYGESLFIGERVWIEINVRDGASTGGYFRLLPRQELSPSPFAVLSRFVEPNAVTSVEISDGSVQQQDLAAGAVGAAQVNSAEVQRRVTASCAPGSSIRSVAADGNVTCEPDSSATYLAGTGLSLVGEEFSIDANVTQMRVLDVCPSGQAISSVAQDGSVTCETDDDTTYTAGSGLQLAGSEFSVDATSLQSRVVEGCMPGYSLIGINQDGSVACEPLPVPARKALSALGKTSLAMAPSGLPVFAFTELSDNTRIGIGTCQDFSCQRTNIETYQHTDETNPPVIVVRSDGRPLITVVGNSVNTIGLLDCTNPQCSSYTYRLLDNTVAVGDHDMAIRPDDTPFIVYEDETNGYLRGIHCHDSGCSAFTPRTLDTAMVSVRAPAIAVRSTGAPVIGYYAYDGFDIYLRSVGCSIASCSGWNVGNRATIGSAGVQTKVSIAMRSNDLAVITYVGFQGPPGDSIYVYSCTLLSCSTGTLAQIPHVGNEFANAEVAVDADDQIWFLGVTRGVANGMELIRCMDASCTTPTRKQLFNADTTVNAAVDLLLRPGRHPMLFYARSSGFKGVESCVDEECSNVDR